MEFEYFNKEMYNSLQESQSAIEGFLDVFGSLKELRPKHIGELKLMQDNFTNHYLLDTNMTMLNDELFDPSKKDPAKIIIFSEYYLTKLGSIGTLTLEQIASSLVGSYDPFNSKKKPKFEEIKKVIEEYANPELKGLFLEDFCNIFTEVRELRNKAAHVNLGKDILIKGPFNPGTWDSQREISPIYAAEIGKDRYGIFKGDLMINSKGNKSSLTDRFSEYGSKYLKMVKSVYENLSNYRKQFIVDGIDFSPESLGENPFEAEI